jgi:chromosome segregation ATPase
MKLVEFYNTESADKNDPLLLIVKDMQTEQTRLQELRKQTQNYLIPVKGKVAFDPDCQAEVETLASEIESSKNHISSLQEKINKVDEILAKNQIERPLLNEMRKGIGAGQRSIEAASEKVAGVLGHTLTYEIHDEAQTKKHPKYLKAVAEYQNKKATIEPKIAKLEQVLSELEAVL